MNQDTGDRTDVPCISIKTFREDVTNEDGSKDTLANVPLQKNNSFKVPRQSVREVDTMNIMRQQWKKKIRLKEISVAEAVKASLSQIEKAEKRFTVL